MKTTLVKMSSTVATTPTMTMEAPTTIIRINEEEDDTFCSSGPVFAADEEPEPLVEPTSGTHSTATDEKPPATSSNLRGSHVRDSLDISNHAVSYIERKCLGDKSELGQSNATERTVDTVATGTSLDDDEEEFESSPPSTSPAEDQQESTTDMLQRQPTKSAMKHKTLQDSLSNQYESTRRKMVRERQLAAKRARKLARAQSKKQNGSSRRIKLKKAISRMSLVSRRNLFDTAVDPDAEYAFAAPKESGSPPASRRASMGSERSGLSKSRSSMDVLSSSEHRAYEEEHNDTVSEMPLRGGKIDRRASLSSFKSAGSHPTSDGEQGPGNDNSSPNRPDAPARSATAFQNKSMRSMRSMRNLLSTSKSRLLGNSLTSLFSHGSKSECFTVDEVNDAELFPTLLSFDTVEIREYDPEVDANPCTSRGPAITLGWSYTQSPPVDFYQYEEYRPPRRQMKEMRLPREVREQRLMASGVSRSEMDRSIKQANIAKQRRSKTLRQLKHYTLHERLEGMKKKCLKMMGKRQSHEEEERKLWEEAQCYFAA